jgi:hypothetical protein
MIAMIWIFWLLNLFLNLIILLNFLIAVISQTYDQVIAEQQLCLFKYMSEYNKEYFTVRQFYRKFFQSFFGPEPDVALIVMTQP